MSFIETLTVGGVMATILGVFLTPYALISNRTLKEEARLTREEIRAVHEEIKVAREEIKVAMEQIAEFRKSHEEHMLEFRKMHKETLEIQNYIADLIVADGERTRAEIRKLRAKIK